MVYLTYFFAICEFRTPPPQKKREEKKRKTNTNRREKRKCLTLVMFKINQTH